MFNNENTRQQAIMHAARGHEGSMRQVLADICERLDALEAGGAPSAGSIDLSDIYERLAALEAGTAPPADVPQEESDVSLDERAMIAIRMMDPETFGADGKPNARAIATALGEPFTAADRDRVWAAMQEDA